MNRKGMELSINFIVMLLIAIVIFGFGLKIGYQLFFTATTTADKLNTDVEKGLMDALTSGSKVAIPEGIIKLKRGESYTTGVGVYNILDGPETFSVSVEKYKYYASENDEGVNDAEGGFGEATWNLNAPSAELKPNEKKVFSEIFKVPNEAKRGTYVFNLLVCTGTDRECTNPDDLYGDKHQIMINVN